MLLAALTVGGVGLLNRYVHGALVDGSRHLKSLRVLSWNIGKIYLPLDSRAADRDLEHVARVIAEADPQIVALQELRGPRQLGRLLARLGPRWRGSVPEDRYDRRAALLTELPVRFLEIETSTGRTAQGAEVTLGDGSKATVASVHLDAFDPERRARQAEEILDSLARLGNEQMVLAGDFNFDSAAIRHDSPDYRTYLLLTANLIDAAKREGGTTVLAQRLDYVFYRLVGVQQAQSQVLFGRRINIMDHDPLVVEIFRHRGWGGAPQLRPAGD